MAINYFAIVAITQVISPHYKKRNRGDITVISSIGGIIGFSSRSGYSASKHATKRYKNTAM
jgi:short-subunit dehydrogenase